MSTAQAYATAVRAVAEAEDALEADRKSVV